MSDNLASDAQEKIQELSESTSGSSGLFNLILISVFALAAAITGFGGANSGEDIVNNNIQASNAYNFYQAKNIRQTVKADDAEILDLMLPLLAPEKQVKAQQLIDNYKATAARYEDEPDKDDPEDFMKGEGKKQLLLRGQHYETEMARAQKQDPNFDYATVLLSIAILFLTVATFAIAKWKLWARGFQLVGALMGLLGVVLTGNGFFLFFNLPF